MFPAGGAGPPVLPCNHDASDPVSARIAPSIVSIHNTTGKVSFALFVKFAATGDQEFEVTGCPTTEFSIGGAPISGENIVGNTYHAGAGGTQTITGSYTQGGATVTDNATVTINDTFNDLLLGSLQYCIEVYAGDLFEWLSNAIGNLFNGATIAGGTLNLDNSATQYAQMSAGAPYEFAGSNTVMVTFQCPAFPGIGNVGFLLYKGDTDASNPDYTAVLEGAGAALPGPAVVITHATTDTQDIELDTDYVPAVNTRFCLFLQFNASASPNTLSLRIYKVGDATINNSIVNPGADGVFHTGGPLTIGDPSSGANAHIERIAGWASVLGSGTMDKYWNSGNPLPFSVWDNGT